MTSTPVQPVDVLIIGAGPAGLSTALHLLQQDASWAGRMLLLEKAAHPRPKLCGGGVTRPGLEILRRLDFPLPLPLPQAQVDNALLVYDRWVIWVEGSPAFAVFHRPELDAYLARQAADRGAVIHENEAVESLVPQADGVIVVSRKATYRAQVVVGADGSKGISRSLVEHNRRRTRVARLLEMLCPASEMSPVFTHHYAVFDFTPLGNGLQGYFWQFPARVNGLPALNCGVYDARLASKRPRARLMSILENGLRTWGGEEVQLSPEGHPIHWFSPRNRFSAPRLLLVGDAAGAEPLFGEGIAPALGYGQVAAASIQAAFASGDFSFRDYRRRLLTSPIGRYLMLRWAVAEVAYRLGDRAWFMPLLWWFSRIVARLWPTSPRLY